MIDPHPRARMSTLISSCCCPNPTVVISAAPAPPCHQHRHFNEMKKSKKLWVVCCPKVCGCRGQHLPNSILDCGVPFMGVHLCVVVWHTLFLCVLFSACFLPSLLTSFPFLPFPSFPSLHFPRLPSLPFFLSRFIVRAIWFVLTWRVLHVR